ncbi:hypothetical protein YSKK_27290 [Halopseudomonas aestusnigri]|nr:hypothetical protein YSKK_27290 [Halopseudomonas aestusnigri]
MDGAKVDGHLERHPDISALATNEVAVQFTDSRVGCSGYDNGELQVRVDDELAELVDSSIAARATDSACLGAGVVSTRALLKMLRGQQASPGAVGDAIKSAGVAGGSTALAAYLFG